MPAVEALIWKLLNKDSCLHFGRECTSVATWTLFVMLFRIAAILARLDDYIPMGVLCAFPFIIQVIKLSFIWRNIRV